MTMFNIGDIVKTKSAYKHYRLKAGDMGTIIALKQPYVDVRFSVGDVGFHPDNLEMITPARVPIEDPREYLAAVTGEIK